MRKQIYNGYMRKKEDNAIVQSFNLLVQNKITRKHTRGTYNFKCVYCVKGSNPDTFSISCSASISTH